MSKLRSLKALSLLTFLSLVCASVATASGGSSFSAEELEGKITRYYRVHDKPSGPAYGAALAKRLALLPPESFNDLLGHLGSDYWHHPENRQAIGALLERLTEAVRPELEAQDEHPIHKFITDFSTAFVAAYAFGFGKSVWQTRGLGLKRLELFKTVLKNTLAEARLINRVYRWELLAAGTGAGAIHAVYAELETKKRNPETFLRAIQQELLHRHATRAAALRDLLTEQARLGKALSEAELEAISAEAETISDEVDLLHESAPELRACGSQTMDHVYRACTPPVRQDLRQIAELLLEQESLDPESRSELR